MTILYVARSGQVFSGRLTTDHEITSEGEPVLMSRGGKVLAPSDVLALLVPAHPTEEELAGLRRANRKGYRVEDA